MIESSHDEDILDETSSVMDEDSSDIRPDQDEDEEEAEEEEEDDDDE